MACSQWRSTAVYLKEYWHPARTLFEILSFFDQVYFSFQYGECMCCFAGVKLALTSECWSMLHFFLTELACLSARRISAGNVSCRFCLARGAEAVRRCV